MPIYEYHCQECGNHFECLQKMNAPALSFCTNCGAEALTKLVSAAGFQLKGSGWYATDFKNNDKKPAKQNEKEQKPDAVSSCPNSDRSDGACPCAPVS